jgi:hypothetical protein
MAILRPELEWQDGDGTIYPLEFPGRHVMEVSGLGMPPVVHWTTRAPFQHGRSHWAYVFQPRTINLVLYNQGGIRNCMFEQRAANVEMLSPRNGAGILRLTYPNGETYEVHDGWHNAGYTLSSTDGTHTTQIGDVQLVFNDPFWKWVTAPLDVGETRDDEGRICVEEDIFTLANELVFPFVGPWLMGTTVATATLTCTNDGSWAVQPVITLEGPCEDWTLTNPANGKALAWDGYSIALGEVVTLDIPNKTVTNGAGDDLRPYVSGNFGTFELEPGANALAFWASGGVSNGDTTLTVCWFVEFLGT